LDGEGSLFGGILPETLDEYGASELVEQGDIMRDSNAALFNTDWKFLLGDNEDAYLEHYPDRTWKHIDIPHDWVIGEPFDRGAGNGYGPQNMQGFFAWKGVAWYRKTFILNGEELSFTGEKCKVSLYFGGAYRNSKVYINGHKAGGRAYGYSSFEVDISGFVRSGSNTVAVRLDNGCEEPDRWYSGSGLYRNVYLRIVPALHIKTWGVRIKTNAAALFQQNAESAEVIVETTIVNQGDTATVRVCLEITDPKGGAVAESVMPCGALGRGEAMVEMRCTIRSPLLWDADNPWLYRAVVRLAGEDGGAIGGSVEVPFGIRLVEILPMSGMKVNGEPIKLKGVCLHHDCGILGAAYYDAAWRRRLLSLKSIGCNAIRVSHNPPAEEFLDLCDELGFYVIDECFDKWRSGYYAAHFDDDWREDLESFILRDRNHPSVFMWSIGNEVVEQSAGTMLETQRMLVAFVRRLDDRPITCALHPHVIPASLVSAPVSRIVEITKELAEDVDVLGLNYQEPFYEAYSATIAKPIVGTESYDYYSSSIENYEDVLPKNPWRYVIENDNVIGQFIWAGIDYLGESSWPAKGWAGALLDICGFLKPNAYYRKSIWSNEPMIYLGFYDGGGRPDYTRGRWSFPQTASHLNLDHFKRRTVKAVVYTNCEEAELWINGKKRGRRRPVDFENGIIEWTFDYEDGGLEVIGLRGGEAVCRHVLRTAGLARRICLSPDKTILQAGRSDIVHIETSITDEVGILCPIGEHLVEWTLRGDGEILGACSPDLNASLGFRLSKAYTSGGKALVIVKAGDSCGVLGLTAYAEGLGAAAFEFMVSGTQPPAA
jgi:beta-galactosidase